VETKKRIRKKHKMDLTLLGILAVMITFGLIMVFSASTPSAFYQHGDRFYFIRRQFIWTVIGFGAMFFMANIDYRIVKKWSGIFCIITLVLMFLVPLIGIEVNGARRWLGIGSLTFQPSEIAKFALILYFAKRMAESPKNSLKNFVYGLLPYLGILALFVGAMILQDHLSAAVVTFAALMVVLLVGGADIKHFIAMGGLGVGVLVPFAFMESYRLKRLMAFMDPFKYAKDIGWQIVQGLYAIGSGGIFGRGLGQARQKFLYVPEAHNDYIYAILCEELGLVGAICVALLFAAFLTRCVIIALNAPDTFSRMTVFGITTLIAFQYIINIGVVTSVLPNTGMQLPFFSAGGSSLVFLMAAMGIILNISKYSNISGRKDELK